MDRIAVALFLELELRINAAVDIVSVTPQDDRRSLQAVMNALGDGHLFQKNIKALFAHKQGKNALTANDAALQAWAARYAATQTHMSRRYADVSRIATDTMPHVYLSALAKIFRDADILESLEPTKVVNDVKDRFTYKDGNVNLESTRFRTRIMTSSNQVIRIKAQVGDKQATITGKAKRVAGRQAQIGVKSPVHSSGNVLSVTTFGKGDLSAAEKSRERVVLEALQGHTSLTEYPFFCCIWAPSFSISWPPLVPKIPANPRVYYPTALNTSQHIAVERILSGVDDDRVLLIQGPPGTGKTTVIAASVLSIIKYGKKKRTIWLLAQSNVAVKNIAEKLDKVEFREFKILVSKDFHFDWHEHLYERLEAAHCFVRSDMFGEDIVSAERLVLDTRVILCTLSMLSNSRISEFTRAVPLQTIIFDEASQIEVGNYLSVLHRFRDTLQKMVFIGDDRQLAPFGQDHAQQLQSVFEFPHLRQRAHFLGTQYRMPVVIGQFISRHVYDSQLKTIHKIKSGKSCRFLDVEKSQEKKSGHSWMNEQEIAVIAKLAGRYRKQRKEYKILTPYDAQRNAIEMRLKSDKLPWENRCFNVDSFQGNEEDHIIISLVRSKGVGFLSNVRRTNVMLTRCKESMVICTSRDFVTSGEAVNTLVGKLVVAMGPEAWLNGGDIDRGNFEL